MSIKHLLAGLTLCLTAHALSARPETISGTVIDETGAPMEFANVTIFSTADSTLLIGTVTDSVGHFSLPEPGLRCFLRVSAIGFDEICRVNPRRDIGTISLSPATYRLGELVVKSSRPLAKLKPDGLQVAIAGTYLANSGTALDLLGKMPFVIKNGSALEVLGKGAPIIYLNGRRLRDQTELNQLAASEIKNVDVVTSPGARYDSSANAVIRITTLRPHGEGFSFNDRTTLGYKHYVYLFEQTNFNFRKNGFDLFAMLNYENYRDRTSYRNSDSQYLPTVDIQKMSTATDFAKYPVYQGKIGINYTMKSHSLGLFYDFSYRPSNTVSTSLTSVAMQDMPADDLTYEGQSARRNRQHLMSAYYNGKLGKWQLSANFDALWQFNSRNTHENEQSSANPARTFSTANNVRNRLLAANFTASLPVWKGELRFGAEAGNISRSDIYLADADFIADNDTRIKETTVAMLAEINRKFGNTSVTVGLRWENTDSRYFRFVNKMEDQSRRYNNFAPNASLTVPLSAVTATLSYMRKTSRPAFEQLSGAIRYLDRYSYETGNPNLRPTYRDYLSASGQWKDLVVECTMYSTKNYFMWQSSPYPADEAATLLRMENMPRFNTCELFANYSPSFFEIWRPAFMAGIIAQDFKLSHRGSEIKLNKPLGIFRFNNAVHLPADIWLNIDFYARTSGNSDNMYLKGYWNCDLGLYKSFANECFTVKLQLNDVFNTSRTQFNSYDAISLSRSNKVLDTRDLSLTIRYNFNPSRSRYRGRGAGDAEKSRL